MSRYLRAIPGTEVLRPTRLPTPAFAFRWESMVKTGKLRRGFAQDLSAGEATGWPARGRRWASTFGAAAHILVQVATRLGRRVLAFTRTGDEAAQNFARSLGAVWAGPSDQPPPEPLDSAIIFAPVGTLVPIALKAVKKGGRVVCGGIHMSDIPALPYALLWEERSIVSVANLTRNDAIEFLDIAQKSDVKCQVTGYPLATANEALADMREGRLQGAAVLIP